MKPELQKRFVEYNEQLSLFKNLKSPNSEESLSELRKIKSSLDKLDQQVTSELRSIRKDGGRVGKEETDLLDKTKDLKQEIDAKIGEIKQKMNQKIKAEEKAAAAVKELSDAKKEIEKSIDSMVKDIKTLRDSKLSDGSTFLKSGDKNLNVINKLIGDLEAAKHLTYHKITDIEQIETAVQKSFTQANAEIEMDPKGKKISDALTKICNFGLKAINMALNVFRKNAKEAVLYEKPSHDYKSKLKQIVESDKDIKSSSNPNLGH